MSSMEEKMPSNCRVVLVELTYNGLGGTMIL